MKKLITILLAVLLIIAMAVPVFAETSNTFSLSLSGEATIYDPVSGDQVSADALLYNYVYYVKCPDNYGLTRKTSDAKYYNIFETSFDNPEIWDASDVGNQLYGFSYGSSGNVDIYYFMVQMETSDSGTGDTAVVSGVYQLKQPFALLGYDFDVTFATPVKLYSGSETYTEYNSISILADGKMLRFYGNTNNGNSGVTGETHIGINSETITYIDFGSTPQEVSEGFSNWLGGNASFFRQVPSLTQVVSTLALEMVMTEVTAILPVGITCLVGYLALRKALQILGKVLYQA